jgi:hypothetical protein
MTGKTYTQKDLTLGGVMTQLLPLQAMTNAEKQYLIDNKQLTAHLLALSFTQLTELTETVQNLSETKVWSSEAMAEDVFGDEDVVDAAELWVKIQFKGLTPSVSLVLREVAGVYQKRYRVVNEWTIDVSFLDLGIDPGQFTAEVSAMSIFSGALCFSELFADVCTRFVEALTESIVVTAFERNKFDRDTVVRSHIVRTNKGSFSFYL